ncbi:MAG: L-rhamnose isomerase [Kiritimatiellia bacterium]
MTPPQIEKAYTQAREVYAAQGVDTERALKKLRTIRLSLHCWQGDDVGGFEKSGGLDGGLAATGNYPGKARTADELRTDLEVAMAQIPGLHRVNLHAIYAETNGQKVGRDELGVEHFANWIGWAKSRKLGLDFNPSYFSHPLAKDGLTLSHPDKAVRAFWIAHGIACRKIGAAMGSKLGSPCLVNLWIPDGYKDTPVDRRGPRDRLRDSLDAIHATRYSRNQVLDAVESKLFGIGSESFVVGSHEFYMGYALERELLLCLDCGHFHPTESVADKISALLVWLDAILVHVSRGVRWDSDHVVTLTDELRAIGHEIVAGDFTHRVHLALDYFDASINRVAAWVIGSRNTLKMMLGALLEPMDQLKRAEKEGDFTARLALQEEFKTLPLAAVWDYHCLKQGVPVGADWLKSVRRHESTVLSKRS